MEIEIESKRNNPLLNRTEIYFTVKHDGEKTPNREIIRSEIAEKLNVDKEKVIVNTIQSSFGAQEISGYAKIYPTLEKTKEIEREFILMRNKLIEKKEKKKGEKTAQPPKEGKPEEKPKEEAPRDIKTEPTKEIKEEEKIVKPEEVKDNKKETIQKENDKKKETPKEEKKE